MDKTEALLSVLKIYGETDKHVTQEFYQTLCLRAAEEIKCLQKALKIAIGYVAKESTRTSSGQLYDIKRALKDN